MWSGSRFIHQFLRPSQVVSNADRCKGYSGRAMSAEFIGGVAFENEGGAEYGRLPGCMRDLKGTMSGIESVALFTGAALGARAFCEVKSLAVV
jgi:hypothetical protein